MIARSPRGAEHGLPGSPAWVERHLNENADERVVLYPNDDPGAGATYGFSMEDDDQAKAPFDRWLAAGSAAMSNVLPWQ